MGTANWTNKWVLMLLAGIIIQIVAYSFIVFFKPAGFISHEFFYDVSLITLVSIAIQIGGFGVIMSKTNNMDASIYGQGRPFQHKLREEDKELATRKPTSAK
ncbi:MAG: hypothetical protein ACE5H4_13050 [Candidatus Thorarchaeota archaeon]